MFSLALLLAVGLGFLLGSLRLFVLALMALLISLFPPALVLLAVAGIAISIYLYYHWR